VGKAIIDHLFPATADGRIPLVGVTGHEGLSETARLVAKGLRLQGHDVGLAHTGGLFFNDRQIDARNAAHWEASQRVLLNRAVQAAVIENSPYTIVSEGLAYDRCHVGIVTSLPETALIPERYIEDEDKLFGVVRTQIDVVLKTGCAVLNADDRLVLEMADLSDGDVVLFTQHSPSAAVKEHIASGKRAVVLNADALELHSGNNVHTIGLLSETRQSAIVALAVCGALSFLGLTTEQIRQNFA
jgi:cyanophycin synthetase